MGAKGPTRKTVGARTGGRSERVVRDVLDATLTELGRVGYANLSLEHVAAVAGVAKTTVYRRWPTRAALVAAAVRARGGLDAPPPDTGSVRGDVLELLRASVEVLSKPEGLALAKLLIEGAGPEIDALARELRDEVWSRRRHVVERAQARGELPSDVDARLIVDAVFTPVLTRMVRFRERFDDDALARLVDLVLTGAEHGGGSARRRPRPRAQAS